MKFLCISASQVKHKRHDSGSTKACELVKEILLRKQEGAEVEIISLVDEELKPCIMCGKCADNRKCPFDESFNKIYAAILDADAVFVVCPHYAPIPSKLMIILEKLEELCYIAWCTKKIEQWPLRKKRIGIIAHGGRTVEYLHIYEEALLKPLSDAFKSVGMDVIAVDEERANGVVFGVTGFADVEGTVFPDMVQDWEDIENRIEPLVDAMLASQNE